MTLVVDVLDRVARQCSVTPPNSWVTATDATSLSIRDDYLRETIDDLAKRVDFPSPISRTWTTVRSGHETHELPSDFLRLAHGEASVYEQDTVRRYAIPVSDDGVWTHLKDLGSAASNRYFRLGGYDGARTIDFYRTPTSGETIIVHYVSTRWVVTEGGTYGDTFSAETDTLIYPRRPVELGTVMRFRKRNGLPLGDMEREYELWIASESNQRRARGTINFGGRRHGKPMRVPVPDFIPPGSS